MRSPYSKAFSALLLAACGVTALEAGSPASAAETQALDLAPYHHVVATGGIDVVISQGERASAHASGSAKSLSRLSASVADGVLTLGKTGSGTSWWPLGRSTLHVTLVAVELGGVEVDIGADVHVHELDAPVFNVTASRGGRLTIKGSCDLVNITASAGAKVDAVAFDCGRVAAVAESGARVVARAQGPSTAAATSGAQIVLIGDGDAVSISQDSGGRVVLGRN